MSETVERKGVVYLVKYREYSSPGRTCKKCKVTKALEDFPVHRTFRNDRKTATLYIGRSGTCSICRDERAAEYYDREKEKGAWVLSSRAKGLMRRYGITEDEYAEMLEAQDGKCAICGNTQGRIHSLTGEPRHLAVDHDHETEIRRGLLCDNCNQGIGLFKDDPDLLMAAALYLLRAAAKVEA